MALAVLAAAVTAVPVTSPAAMSSGGGITLPDPPEISDVICLTQCAGLREVAVGGTIQVTGRNLAAADTVTFAGADGRIAVAASSSTANSVVAPVPAGAITGKVQARDQAGSIRANSPAPLTVVAANTMSAAKTGTPLQITDATTTPYKAYYFGVRPPKLTYVISGGQPTNDLRIDVVRSDGTVVRSMFRSQVPINSSQTIRWNGKTSDGRIAPNGPYSFVIKSASGETATLSKRARKRAARAARTTAAAPNPLSFKMYGYIFPVRGAHTYGDSIGAARAGHTHQGLDVLAKCGVPLVAARGGTVHYNSYQAGGAGNYIVISPLKGTKGRSHVYMHMAARSPLKVGQTVKTGQRIGVVGTTGSSTACHLHFEEWTAPGWYEGGTFVDPLPSMQRWDRYS